MNKKDLPLKVLKALEPFVGLHGKLFQISHTNERLLTVLDKDEKSKFRFFVSDFEKKEGRYIFTVAYSPFSENITDLTQKKVFEENLHETFNIWVSLLEEYASINSFFDDPILKTYEAEFTTNFELTDENAEVNPFSVSQLIQFDDLLDQVSTRLISMADVDNRQELDTIVAEIACVRENLSSRSQKWVVEHVSRIFGKIAKQGMKFMKEFWSEGKKELIKTIVKGAIESGTDILL